LAWFCVDYGIAADAVIGYNLPVNKKMRKKLQFVNFLLRSKADRENYQKMGICPFFFCFSGFALRNVEGAGLRSVPNKESGLVVARFN
jgi:hypothetical protein